LIQSDDVTVRRARKAMRNRIKQTSIRAVAQESGIDKDTVVRAAKLKTSLHDRTKTKLVQWYMKHVFKPRPSKEEVMSAIDVLVTYADRPEFTRSERHTVLQNLIRQVVRKATASHV
jgi:hypothetical protein